MSSQQGRHDIARGRQKKTGMFTLKRYGFFFLVFIVVLAKSLIFIGLTANRTASVIDFAKAFPDLPPIFVYLCFELLVLSFAFLFKGRFQAVYLILIDILLSLIFIIDLCSYRNNGSLLSLYLSSGASSLKDLGQIFSLIRIIDLLFLIDIPYLVILFIKNKHEYKKVRMHFAIFIFCIIISMGYLGIKVLWNNSSDYGSLDKTSVNNPKQTIFMLSPLGYHIYDIYSYISSKH